MHRFHASSLILTLLCGTGGLPVVGFNPQTCETHARAKDQTKPNIVFILADDLGWSDTTLFGTTELYKTPNIERLARRGMTFTRAYSSSPLCSPTRASVLTGLSPARHGITAPKCHLPRVTLNATEAASGPPNQKATIPDSASRLDTKYYTLPKMFRDNGYATGHFGKWHMGGQRDVDDAPPITAYGFDQSLTNFEGMGPKLLPLTMKPGDNKPGRIWADAERLGDGFRWMQRSEITSGFVDAAIPFINQSVADGKPFYVNLWPDDVHGPFWPPVDKWADGKRGLYLSVLQEMDRQFGKLFDMIRDSETLRNNTLVLICSDNGPEQGAGTAGPFRGFKTQLYEGGVRSSLIAWGPGLLKKSSFVDRGSVFSAIDLVPTLLAITGTPAPNNVMFDGESLPNTLLGLGGSRDAPIMFRRPPDRNAFYGDNDLPDLAMRAGQWKFLCEYDGSKPQLYNLKTDAGETTNVAEQHPAVVDRLQRSLVAWHKSMPPDNGATYQPPRKKKKK